MSTYVSTSVFPNGTTVEYAIETLLDLGIDHIELSSVHQYEENLLVTAAHFQANYLTHNFFPPTQERLILNLASSDEHIRQSSIAFVKQGIDFAEKLDARVYTIHPGFLADPKAESSAKNHYDFQFPESKGPLSESEYEAYFSRFIHAMKELRNYLQGKEVQLAVETQGAVAKKAHVLFARPEEWTRFCQEFTDTNIGLNLNLGHLNLAANAWGFDKDEAVQSIKNRILAVEVTHNEGVEDEHRALVEGAWYWRILKDSYFKSIPVIFEGRFIAEADILKSYEYLKEVLG